MTTARRIVGRPSIMNRMRQVAMGDWIKLTPYAINPPKLASQPSIQQTPFNSRASQRSRTAVQRDADSNLLTPVPQTIVEGYGSAKTGLAKANEQTADDDPGEIGCPGLRRGRDSPDESAECEGPVWWDHRTEDVTGDVEGLKECEFRRV